MLVSYADGSTEVLLPGMGEGTTESPGPADSDSDSGYDDFLALCKTEEPPEVGPVVKKSSPPPVVEWKTAVGSKEEPYADAKGAPMVRGVTKDTVASSEEDEESDDEGWLDGPKEDARATGGSVAATTTTTFSDSEPAAPSPVSTKTPRSDSANAAVSHPEPKQAKPSAGEEPSVAPSVAASVLCNLSLHPDAPPAVEYFTKKAALEDVRNTVSMRKLALENMSDAHRYFDKKTTEAAIKHAAECKAALEEPRPAAVEYFTLMEMEKQSKRQAANERALEEPAPAAVEFFTTKARLEKEARDEANQRLRDNPPPTSVATAYFGEKEEQRKLELERMMQEPAPAAVEYFTKKAEEEQKRAKAAMARSDARNGEASVATTYFEKQKSVKEEEIKANREIVNNKPYEEPLPIDYFTKMGEAETAIKAKSMRDLAQSQADKGTLYFTAKAEEERAAALAKHAEGHPDMSVATKYFNRLAAEKKAEEERKAREEPEPMPAAIQKFTMEAYKEREKKKAEIQALHDNPAEMAPGQAYFTNRMMEEKAKRDAENRALRENPPPTSVATAYFAEKESQRKLEIERMMQEPAPAAVEYFSNKAREEQERAAAAMARSQARNEEASVATLYFEKQKSVRAEEIKAKREEINNRPPPKQLPIDYFTKLGEAETAAKAEAQRDLADSLAPEATLYFTRSAEEAEKAKMAEFEEGHADMSVATKYFNKKAAEEKARGSTGEAEIMPAAIQKFTTEMYEERARKKKQLEDMKVNPPEIPPGMAHFTPGLN